MFIICAEINFKPYFLSFVKLQKLLHSTQINRSMFSLYTSLHKDFITVTQYSNIYTFSGHHAVPDGQSHPAQVQQLRVPRVGYRFWAGPGSIVHGLHSRRGASPVRYRPGKNIKRSQFFFMFFDSLLKKDF